MQRLIFQVVKSSGMRNRDIKILCELLKNGRISDRELAKKLNISQSTVTRARHRLEKKEILSYIAVPNLINLDINIFACNWLPLQKEIK